MTLSCTQRHPGSRVPLSALHTEFGIWCSGLERLGGGGVGVSFPLPVGLRPCPPTRAATALGRRRQCPASASDLPPRAGTATCSESKRWDSSVKRALLLPPHCPQRKTTARVCETAPLRLVWSLPSRSGLPCRPDGHVSRLSPVWTEASLKTGHGFLVSPAGERT